MKILITGGNGFLGRNIVPLFEKTNNTIFSPSRLDLNLLWPLTQITKVVVEFNPDIILHLAAECGGILANSKDPVSYLTKNITMGQNIYECARILNINTVHTLGSVCSYPKFCPLPFKEEDLWNGYPEETNAPYGIAKRVLLMLAQTYREKYGIGGSFIIPANMYGEHDHFDTIFGHVIPALIKKATNAKLNNTDMECWGSGNATRQFLYVKDAANIIRDAVLQNVDENLPINIGSGCEISMTTLAQKIADMVGFTGNIVFNGKVSDGQPRRFLDCTRQNSILNVVDFTSFDDGLRKTIDFYNLFHRSE